MDADLVKKAKQFAKERTGGMSSRIREQLETMKPAIQILVNERLALTDIQEFIRRETGLKLNREQVELYCSDHFDYPPAGAAKPQPAARAKPKATSKRR